MKDGICAPCWQKAERPPPEEPDYAQIGFCVTCGYFYDCNGSRILDITVTCPVHSPIKASCPHSLSLRRPPPQGLRP